MCLFFPLSTIIAMDKEKELSNGAAPHLIFQGLYSYFELSLLLKKCNIQKTGAGLKLKYSYSLWRNCLLNEESVVSRSKPVRGTLTLSSQIRTQASIYPMGRHFYVQDSDSN